MENYIIIGLLVLVTVLVIVLLAKYRSAGQEVYNLNRQLKMQSDMLLDSVSKTNSTNAENAFRMRQEITEQFGQLNKMTMESLEQVSRLNERNSDRLRMPVEERLAEMQKTVDERLQKSLHEGIDSSFKRVSDQLTELYKSMGEVKTLTSGVGDLKNILSNVKNRGIWGEVQLQRLLDDFMVPGQYTA
ncbi:MAG: DNA recombination protein RmuC, partial [Eubacteriales bacterium]